MLRLLLAVLLAGCGAAPDAVVGAVIMTTIAATSSGISRATGGCYAGCPAGTVCNSVNGLCEVLPCRGLCSDDQDCDESGIVAKCVRKKADITITTEKEDSAPPEESQPPE